MMITLSSARCSSGLDGRLTREGTRGDKDRGLILLEFQLMHLYNED